jgi:hypothetical protein
MTTTVTDTLPDLDLVTHHPDRVAHCVPWASDRTLCGLPLDHLRSASPASRKCPECEHLANIDRFNRR